jgi:hypothetical protein
MLRSRMNIEWRSDDGTPQFAPHVEVSYAFKHRTHVSERTHFGSEAADPPLTDLSS